MLLNQFENIRRLVKCLVFFLNSEELSKSEKEDLEILINQLIDKIE